MEGKRGLPEQFLIAAVSGDEAKANAILANVPEMPSTNMYVAAALGEADIVKQMLERDPVVAVRPGGPENGQPLLYACFSCFLRSPRSGMRFEETVKLLLACGADANAYVLQRDDPFERKLSCLYGAIGVAGSRTVAELLLEVGADPNDGESLYHAAERPGTELLDVLYRYGVDVNATPALFRKLDFDDDAGVRWFLEHGADLTKTLGDHGTPLHWAVYRGRSAAIVEQLLRYGAPVNARRADGKTAYMLAVRFGRTELLELLTLYGASTEAGSVDRLFGAYSAANKPAVSSMIAEQPALLASLSARDRMMLLEYAESNNAAAVRLMLETGFDCRTARAEGTALHIAAWFGHIETVRVLIEHDATLTIRNEYGGTPLGSAIHGSLHSLVQREGAHAEVADALIRAGAAVPVKASGSEEVRKVLRRYGAAD